MDDDAKVRLLATLVRDSNDAITVQKKYMDGQRPKLSK